MPAGVADGALIVNTKVDNSGFMRGARQFQNAVEHLKRATDSAGKSMARSAGGYAQAMRANAKAAKAAAAEMARLEKQAAKLQAAMSGDKAFSEDYKALIDQIKATEAEIEKLQAKQQEWADMGISPDSSAFSEVDRQIFELMDRIDELKAKQAELKASGGAYSPEFDAMRQQYEEIQGRLEALRQAGNDVANGGCGARHIRSAPRGCEAPRLVRCMTPRPAR